MAASALAIAAQITPVAITATEAIIKGALFAQQVRSSNLMNKAQWLAMWDMADTQFLSGYDAVMGINPAAPVTTTQTATPTPAPVAAAVPVQTAAGTPAPSTSTTTAAPNPTPATVA